MTRKNIQHAATDSAVSELASFSERQRRAHANAHLLAKLLLCDRLYIAAVTAMLWLKFCRCQLRFTSLSVRAPSRFAVRFGLHYH